MHKLLNLISIRQINLNQSPGFAVAIVGKFQKRHSGMFGLGSKARVSAEAGVQWLRSIIDGFHPYAPDPTPDPALRGAKYISLISHLRWLAAFNQVISWFALACIICTPGCHITPHATNGNGFASHKRISLASRHLKGKSARKLHWAHKKWELFSPKCTNRQVPFAHF